jgi:hypothetical protein
MNRKLEGKNPLSRREREGVRGPSVTTDVKFETGAPLTLHPLPPLRGWRGECLRERLSYNPSSASSSSRFASLGCVASSL